MSKLPLIHSISTVGIIKHYNQDYLLHPDRTDFTGDNGIGKSLMADLLQILFIADKSKIKFGTESFKEDERQIHTIPYNSSDAYFFINIEKEAKQYLTFGVNISNASTSPIRIFRILNQPFNAEQEKGKTLAERKKLSSYLIPEEKLPYHADFLIENTIPRVEDLVRHLRDSKELFLTFYTTKSDKKELYQFLFDKEVLPLNLCNDNHLNAFAKVIQVFSKANTLDIDSDRSLKNFLFENKKAAIEAEYNANKKKLDELVYRYNELIELTDDLKNKRQFLEKLKEKEEEFIELEKLYYKNLYTSNKTELENKVRKWKKEEDVFNELSKEISQLNKSVPDLKKNKEIAIKNHESFQQTLKNLELYSSGKKQLEKQQTDLHEIKTLKLPDVSTEKHEPFDFKSLEIGQIKSRVDELSTVLEKYKSIEGIKNQFNVQTDKLENYKLELKKQKEQQVKLQQLLNFKEDGSLASQIIQERKTLSKPQESVLLKLLIEVKWQKPEIIEDALQYTEHLDVLEETNITEDKKAGGYWLKLGKLNVFSKYSKDEQLFDNADKMKEAFEKQSKIIEKKLLEIDRFIKDVTNRNFDYIKNHRPKTNLSWDDLLPDLRKIEEYQESVAMVKNLGDLESQLQEEINKGNESLNKLNSEIPFDFNDADLKSITEEKLNFRQKLNKKQLKATEQYAEAKTDLRLKSKELKNLNFNSDIIEEEKQDANNSLIELRSEIERKYPYFFNDFKASNSSIESIDKKYFSKKSVYENAYTDAVEDFPNLGDDIEYNEQVMNETYSFIILERKLLGYEIAETKNIEIALRNANERKRDLSSTLRQTMLKIFRKTQKEYDDYKTAVSKLNTFFRKILISKTYFFQVVFEKNSNFSIEWVNDLESKSQNVGDQGELFESDSVEKYVEEFFKEASGFKSGISFSDLLDPKTYFSLSTEFKDEEDDKNSGSTGQSYAARVLLGIGRLSKSSKEERIGLRFLILEEVSNLDESNFNIFSELTKELDYQIITMTPEPFGSNSTGGWYLHQLIEGKEDKKINYTPNSSFKTNFDNEQLGAYLKRIEN